MRTSALSFVLAVLAAHGVDTRLPAGFEEARGSYYQAIQGDKQAYRATRTMFSRMYRQNSAVPLVQVYYGSLCLLEASHTWALWNKNKLSTEGIGLMDNAVKAQPDNLEIRFVRAVTTYHLPSFFHREQQSKQDFAYLAGIAVSATRKGSLQPQLAAASLYFHGKFLHQAGRDELAKASWLRAIAVAPSSPAAAGAREELGKIKR